MMTVENTPPLWRDSLPVHRPDGHKYDHGVAVILGAPEMTGATRLAARACARMGAGLVKVVAPDGTGAIYRTSLHEESVVTGRKDFAGFGDKRIKVLLAGPGTPPAAVDCALIAQAVEAGVTVVLDAGAIAAWTGAGVPSRLILTPHEGEFAARFGPPREDRIAAALAAAQQAGATVVLKGAQTIVAAAGRAILHNRAVPELATAGTGDVLAGMIAGLAAQGMEAADAAAAAVWMHAEAAHRFGRGMVAGDLPDMIPSVWKDIT